MRMLRKETVLLQIFLCINLCDLQILFKSLLFYFFYLYPVLNTFTHNNSYTNPCIQIL